MKDGMLSAEVFSKMMDRLVSDCEAALEKYLPDPNHMPAGEEYAATVADAMRYSVLAGGKRLRPLLIAHICDLYGGRRELAKPFMAALEMIHTYSLVHDDLPAMDDDEYRRGRKTTHIVYGEGMAVLAGDALLNYAYETALEAFSAACTERETAAVIRALRILAHNAGIYGMVGGQCADLEAEGQAAAAATGPAGGTGAVPSEASGTLEYIHSHKTASMIQSAFQIGAVLAGAPEEDVGRLGRIALDIGVAFQIRDDILDVMGDSEELGKPVGSDDREEKTTWVSLFGLSESERRLRALTDEALGEIDALQADGSFLRALTESLVSRRK